MDPIATKVEDSPTLTIGDKVFSRKSSGAIVVDDNTFAQITAMNNLAASINRIANIGQ